MFFTTANDDKLYEYLFIKKAIAKEHKHINNRLTLHFLHKIKYTILTIDKDSRNHKEAHHGIDS